MIAWRTNLAHAHPPKTLFLPPDSPRWDLQGQADVTEYQGRRCLHLDGGAALEKGFEIRDGVVGIDVATTAIKGLLGIDFRLAEDAANGERVYLRAARLGASRRHPVHARPQHRQELADLQRARLH